MRNKAKKKKILIGIIVILLVIAFIYFIKNNVTSSDGLTLSISQSSGDSVLLDFCNSEQNCKDYLSNEGMPEEFLESNGYLINCQNGNCYLKKV